MTATHTTIEHDSITTKPVFGEVAIYSKYFMTATDRCNVGGTFENTYEVLCRLRGLDACDPQLDVSEIKWLHGTMTDGEEGNEYTLTEDGAKDLFEMEHYIQLTTTSTQQPPHSYIAGLFWCKHINR